MLQDLYPWLKVLHIIAVIALMAGTMYLPRLFIYHHQSEVGGEAEKLFIQMERRLLKQIMNPSLVAVWLFGILLLVAVPSYVTQPWFILKFLFVLGISGIHGIYAAAAKKFAAGERVKTEKYWRIINEVPFVLMILIVILVIVKPF